MKKVLFTLATLVMVSLVANAAGDRPEVGLSAYEITLNAGETQRITGEVTYLGGVLVQGVQWNFTMYDANGQMLDHGCHLELLEEYGTRDMWGWFGLKMIGANGTVYNNGTAITSSNGTYHQTDTWDDEGDYMPDNDYGVEGVNVTYTGKYNFILANVQSNQIFTTRMSYPLQVAEFSVKMEEGYEGEYAILKMEKAEFARPNNDVLNLEGDELPQLKIINGSYAPGTQDLAGEIVIGDVTEDGLLPVSYNGEEEVTVTVTVNGETVEIVDGMVQLAEGENTVVVTVSGDGYNDLVETVVVTYEAPQPPVQTPNPTIEVTPGEDCFIFTAVGEGEVTLWVDQQQVENPYTVYRTEVDQTISLTAVAHVDGQIDGTVTGEYIVPALEPITPPEPEQTEMPEITYEVQDDAVIITATGEGEVLLYIDGVLVDNPVTIARGTEEFTVTATATAQGEDMLISDVATLEITIPAVGGETPEDPYATGYWVVFIDKDGNPQYYKLEPGDDPNGVQTSVALGYGLYGVPTQDDWFNVDFYFLVDGVMYAADEFEKEPNYGNANENPLFEGENYWAVPVGYKYVVGILTDPDTGDLYMQISKGILVGVDEFSADKTVAGVRYFNMAGQEMSEVNGMTIVVTTYTDGTTSAAKVIK